MTREFLTSFVTALVVTTLSSASHAAIELRTFAPHQYVPVSIFVTAKAGSPVESKVSPSVLKFITGKKAKLYFAFCPIAARAQATPCPKETITYRAPDSVDTATGVIKIGSAPSDGPAVLATDAFKNELPVVTHWDQKLNGGRGGQSTH